MQIKVKNLAYMRDVAYHLWYHIEDWFPKRYILAQVIVKVTGI